MELASVIKCEGDNSTFIWKHPKEDFNTKSQLIVHESQEAIFFMNGQALDSFGPGRYTLETENIPLIRQFYHLITGDEPFHCEVYFINKIHQMAIKWGTDSKIQYIEPEYGFPIEIGACGEMGLQVNNGRKLLLKLVGAGNSFSVDDMSKVFRAFLMVKVKPYISKVIKEQKISIFETDTYLELLSSELCQLLTPDFEDYGLDLKHFFVTSILKPDGDPAYERFKGLHFRKYSDVAEAELKQQVDIIEQTTEARKRVIDAQSMAQKRQIEGYTYQEERSFDVAGQLAQNEGVGNFTSAGIGMGLISGIGSSMSTMASEKFSAAFTTDNNVLNQEKGHRFCTNCGKQMLASMKFCPYCGKETIATDDAVCEKCGYSFTSEEEKFCSNCGSKRG